MTQRSTVSIDRSLLQRVDAWAADHGLPTGPGHRAAAVERLLRTVLNAELAS